MLQIFTHYYIYVYKHTYMHIYIWCYLYWFSGFLTLYSGITACRIPLMLPKIRPGSATGKASVLLAIFSFQPIHVFFLTNDLGTN